MPLGNDIGKFLFSVAEQKDGFSFGKPWRQSNTSLGLVIPILREKAPKRGYKMVEETKKGDVTIQDTGAVNTASVSSDVDFNVFIRSGSILEGKGQTRAVVSGIIVLPNGRENIEVKCVYLSKPTHAGAEMTISDVAPPIIMQSLKSSQRETWNSVSSYYACAEARLSAMHGSGGRRIGMVRSRDDDLLGTMREVQKVKKSIEGAIKDIPLMKNQVGAIIFDISTIVGFEVFDSPESWKAMHQKVLEKYDEVLMKKQDEMLFELKPDVIPKKIAEFIEDMMKSDEKTYHENKQSSTIVIDGNRHIGEYTLLDGKVIHVIAFKRERERTDVDRREEPHFRVGVIGTHRNERNIDVLSGL